MSSMQPDGTVPTAEMADENPQDQEVLAGAVDVPTGFKVVVAAVVAILTFGVGVTIGKKVVRRIRH